MKLGQILTDFYFVLFLPKDGNNEKILCLFEVVTLKTKQKLCTFLGGFNILAHIDHYGHHGFHLLFPQKGKKKERGL